MALQRLPGLGDPRWLDVNQLQVSRRSGFRTRIGTTEDQIAVAPGYLEREWRENGRRYFEYAMDTPIWPFVSFSSARYAVARDRWKATLHPCVCANAQPAPARGPARFP